MDGRQITKFVRETVMELDHDNRIQFEMLEDFAEHCGDEGKPAMNVRRKKNRKYIKAGDHAGFVCLSDGTLVEVLPKTSDGKVKSARIVLCRELCRRCGFNFIEEELSENMSFMDYIITVFAKESMKIIKSGLLSAYVSKEENMTSVQGAILFHENIRRNLVHRERLYVRHDVFSPDRAENRLMKAAAMRFIKLTSDPRISQQLKQVISFLDEVKLPTNFEQEFAKCINTRNTKKYSTVLGICRMLFDSRGCAAFSGKFVRCALFFKLSA